MRSIVILGLFGVIQAQFVPQPFGFQPMQSVSGSSGYFDSQPGFPNSRYTNGTQKRWVVTVPQEQRAQMTLNMADSNTFRLRPYDFAVMYDGSKAAQLTNPCNTASYQALGTPGVDYQSVVVASISNARTFTSPSNVAVMDLCVNAYSSGPSDPNMMGFRCFWNAVGGGQPTPPTNPTRPPTQPTQPTAAPTPFPTQPPPPPPTAAPGTVRCGVAPSGVTPSQALQRIVGGVVAPAQSWPWACALVESGGQFCDCTILNANWVVTAGHCTTESTEATMVRTVQVYYGSQNLVTAKRSNIIRVIRNPNYDATYTSNDVALIKLATPIPNWDASTSPICLPSFAVDTYTPEATAADGRSLAFVAGWGTLTEGQTSAGGTIGSGSDTLRQTTIEMYPRSACTAAYGQTFPASSICGGIPQGGRDSCQGDSGGPLIARQPPSSTVPYQNYALIGIVSFGEGCARAGLPGAYTDVIQMVPWINAMIAQN